MDTPTPRWSARIPGHAILYGTGPDRPRRHRHRDWELNLVVCGTGACRCGGRRIALRPGVLLWIPPGTMHGLVRRSRDLAMWVAWFTPSLAARLRDETPPEMTAAVRGGGLERSAAPAATAALAALAAEVRRRPPQPARAAAALTLLWAGAWDACAAAVPAVEPEHPAVAACLRRLVDGDDRPVATLARACGLSANRLSSRFAAATGTTISAWRARRRLDLALGAGGTWAERAAAAGFGSYAQFARIFRRHLGCAPSAWRPGPG